MFKSFFPAPLPYFLSAVLWAAACVWAWNAFAARIGSYVGLEFPPEGAAPVIGVGYFVTPDFLFLYVYYAAATGLFAGFWHYAAPHRWSAWSVLGSALILFSTYFSVQVAVAVNNWRRPFFDMVQSALSAEDDVTAGQFYGLLITFSYMAFLAMAVYVGVRFFVSHYVFRWRAAMNEYYMSRWRQVRHIEGAAQRVQEDTMRFASIMQVLGVELVESVMTLFAFLPVLLALSAEVTELPFFGNRFDPSLVYAAVFWSLFGTVLLLAVGVKLPGLEFRNQRVEAAYRKELVHGEDDEARARPPTVEELFANVRKNYFRLYFHYMYFNVARGFYVQADGIFAYLILIPTIAAGKVTLGIVQQILTAFNQVSNSLQYLVSSWPTIIDLMSIYKRLKAFEAAIDDRPLPGIDAEWLARVGATDDPLSAAIKVERS